jgi:hypothetical protein
MSISTRRGDSGQTDLVGGVRTSKASLRVESYGTIDELISQLGFVRSIAPDAGHRDLVKETERTLFLVCALLATPPDFGRQRPAHPRTRVVGPPALRLDRGRGPSCGRRDGRRPHRVPPGGTAHGAPGRKR